MKYLDFYFNYFTIQDYERNAIGGPYLGVHLRRGDFVRVRSNQIPTLKYAAKQIRALLRELKLNTTFIATDASDEEFNELKNYLKSYKITRYKRTKELKDGEIAIIDQIICSHAKYFIGTYESTFSFRIQEEREILGFKPETTFNRFCSENNNYQQDDDEKCDKTSKWLIVN
jgi:peptide-O-fucosyltransferase